MENFVSIVNSINNVVWGTWGLTVFPVLVMLCLLAGLFYTVLTRFVQVRLFSEMVRLIKSNKSSDQGISSFQALAVSLSGRVGVGNIAGVATAIGIGGPGAIFWMWVVAILGAATAYIEATLGQIYKETDTETGEYRGGPAFYIEKAMGQKWYAWIFAIATIIACGLLLPTVQSNAIGGAIAQTLGEGTAIQTSIGVLSSYKIITGLVIVTMLGFIIFGGVKRIANFAQIVVPFMALTYIITALAVIGLNIDQLPSVIGSIFADAFTPIAWLGTAIGIGVKRGVYSNEAGQGIAPHAARCGRSRSPSTTGLSSVIFDLHRHLVHLYSNGFHDLDYRNVQRS
ncbi:MAG: sodium:alanine symporter family protein [Arenicella sp.]|nr:sodium:alanine symporter family protein [Arenicella sp.]